MVKVCDAIMGTGKSQSAITYMNEHKDGKFIYITPYLDEASRIKRGCPDLRFVEPSDRVPEFGFKKSGHTAALIKAGRNITTTHQAFKNYTTEMVEDIKNFGYTLIIDESVDVLETFDFHADDLQMAVNAGYVSEVDGIYKINNLSYKGRAMHEMFRLMKTREIVRIDEDASSLFYWALPPSLFTAFKDVFILTYLFKGQSLHHFLEIYNIPYKYIGIEKTDSGTGFRFSDYPGYTPEYVSSLKNMVHIVDGRVNDIGEDYYALSMNWYDRNKQGVEKLKKNLYNTVCNLWRDIPAAKKLWSTYNSTQNEMKGKGYSKSFITFNARATNDYKDRICLAYLVNVFMNVNEKKFYQKRGVEVDEDLYALSAMIQCIWRMAIRTGDEIYLYIPSSRMRALLTNWIDSVSKGGNLVA